MPVPKKRPSIRRGVEPEHTQRQPQHKLPHERDESTDDSNAEPQEVMRQAQRDLESGQVDTDLRSTPGLDAQRRRAIVKGGKR